MQGRKLEKGVGYSTIYCSKDNREKYELSTNGTILRRTFGKNNVPYEELYEKVSDPQHIKNIEARSPIWKVFGVNSGQDYYVINQENSYKQWTGNIKIIKKINAKLSGIWKYSVEEKRENSFSYYVKRGKV